ncbi:MAG TPA: histidine phosphatase family protein [Candidatus Saccharimonadales bacterium]|nr:histidine phosphatase family protein [Candidatus Saccharimonadales bacterium]
MQKLYFVRHGQSQANIDKVFAGHLDTPLTALGRQQAKAAGAQAALLSIDHIVSSPLVRAHETAIIMAQEIGFPADNVELNSLLMERNYGSLQGKPWDIDMDMDGIVDIETVDSILERARLAYEHLQALPYGTILVVSHGTFAQALRSVIDPTRPFKEDNEFINAKVVKLV